MLLGSPSKLANADDNRGVASEKVVDTATIRPTTPKISIILRILDDLIKG